MVRGRIGLHRPALFALAGVLVLAVTGCPKDPYDPDTWIAKLDDVSEVERAIVELERLGHPKAIQPLAKVWERHNKSSRVLRIIINLASQTCPEERKADTERPCNENELGGPYWEHAIPVLERAVKEFDITDRRSIEDAMVAADALGRAGNPGSIPTLVDAATRKMPKLSPGRSVRIAAVRALGNYGSDPRAVETLLTILDGSPEVQPVELNAAAANALAETGSEQALQPLLKALYAISPIFFQVRAAITRVGAPAVTELIRIYEGKHTELNAYAKSEGFSDGCDQAMGPGTRCQAPGNLEYKAALMLGDLRARQAIPVLVKGLKAPPRIAFFDTRSGAPGPHHHTAILDALKKIGDRAAAEAVYNYMIDSDTLDEVRPIAIDTFSWLSSGDRGLTWLERKIRDDSEEEQIRKASGLAYGRLVTQQKQLGPLDFMIKRYAAEAAKYDERASKATDDQDKGFNERTAEGYRDLVREFQQHKVRALVGINCKRDAACYVKHLDISEGDAIALLSLPQEDVERMNRHQRAGFWVAARERALFEIMKLGPDAREAASDRLLALSDSTEGFIREGVLYALPQVVERPCPRCVERLSQVIESQQGQTTLDRLVSETRVALHYFMSATAD
jgi:HEAT repeat protein